jgi:acyl-CoA thioesterase-1
MSVGCVGSLAACGGGGGSGAPVTAPAASIGSPVVPPRVVVAEFGDSTTYGTQVINGIGVRAAMPEPAWIQIYLQSEFDPTVTTRNFGMPGTFAAQLVNGWTPYVQAFPQYLYQNQDAQIVVLNFGMNDAHLVYQQDYQYAMTQLIQQAQAAGKTVVLEEPNPSCDTTREQLLPQFVQVMDGLATQFNLPIIRNYSLILQNIPDWQSQLTDCIHPDDTLYQYKAYQANQVITPLVAKIRKG